LRLHNFLYKLISAYASILNGGIHPKHEILKYKEWFEKNIDPNSTVLDIGCHEGSLPRSLAKKASFVYGIEIVEKHVARAKELNTHKNVDYICTDATTYNFEHLQPIHYITLSNVLEHIEHRIDFLQKIIHNVQWATSHNQIILIRVPMLTRDWLTLYKKNMGIEYRLDLTHFTEYTIEEFKNEVEQSGLTILKHEIKFGEIYAVCKVL
jgi:2-polyprenyl-3-methyl-5-hydroxy-6-metoxy-1,4-benzoquinol methylase